MSFAWFGRFLRVQKSNSQVQRSAPANTDKAKSKRNTRALARQYSHLLENSFFAAILDASEEEFSALSEKQKAQAKKVARKLVNHNLTLDKLPRRPASLPMLIKILRIDSLDYAEISKVLLNDPALTAKILQMANSPVFRLSEKKIDNVEQALLLLGIGGLKKVVTAAVMNPLFVKNGPKSAFYNKVWQWALLAGNMNDKYAQQRGESEGALYLLGLLPAVAFLIILEAMDECERENPELGPIHPAVRKLILGKMGVKLCLAIRAQWGLSEDYDRYISEAGIEKNSLACSPLRDAVVLATHVFLEDQSASPLTVEQLTNILGNKTDVDRFMSMRFK